MEQQGQSDLGRYSVTRGVGVAKTMDLKGRKSWMHVPFALYLVMVLLPCPADAQSQSDESKAQLHLKIAQAALSKDDLPIATEELKIAIKYAPNNATLYYDLALIKSRQGDFPQAKQLLDQAAKLGIPAELKEQTKDLLASVIYQLRSKATKVFQPYLGVWYGQMETYSHHSNDPDCTNQVESRIRLTLQMDEEGLELNGNLSLEQWVTSPGCPPSVASAYERPGTYSYLINFKGLPVPRSNDPVMLRQDIEFVDNRNSGFHGALALPKDSQSELWIVYVLPGISYSKDLQLSRP